MRTDQPTHPIAPTATDRHVRWPQHNDDAPIVEAASIVEAAPVPVIEPVTPITRFPLRGSRDEGPLPAVGEYWTAEYWTADDWTPGHVGTVDEPVRYPHTSGWATAALISGLVSVPLVLLLGIGGILGVLAVILGVVGVRQIRRDPLARGTGRAITGIVVGTGSAVIGIPILALVLTIGSLL